ncbi:pyridoxamine 5'-phosphate oxidase family protein [Fictibacillus barbaricus]|uniref:Pyridoxamine 5'-phosphate oxidase family protein n=1 Tax=Fictibacillus barbaricus TaxID=182136 RepID=A0ABU1TXH7_9BACL|nr:pyridoxamine 5'-phosphate oxidase family protein [Fictibacillus barbaricus]MDR7071917.1 putative pyridoxamine 5'-phosphate oxidase family protein [Fictibacillus barbaricus]
MAKQEIPTTLSPELFDYLQGEQLVLLGTVDAESKAPSVNAISWVKSLSEEKIRFTVTNNSRIVTNIKENPNVVLTVVALETVYSINGKANILEDTMQDVPLKLSKIEVIIEHVFESMFWGAKVVQEPVYEKTYNEKKAKELDEKVYKALMA